MYALELCLTPIELLSSCFFSEHPRRHKELEIGAQEDLLNFAGSLPSPSSLALQADAPQLHSAYLLLAALSTLPPSSLRQQDVVLVVPHRFNLSRLLPRGVSSR